MPEKLPHPYSSILGLHLTQRYAVPFLVHVSGETFAYCMSALYSQPAHYANIMLDALVCLISLKLGWHN